MFLLALSAFLVLTSFVPIRMTVFWDVGFLSFLILASRSVVWYIPVTSLISYSPIILRVLPLESVMTVTVGLELVLFSALSAFSIVSRAVFLLVNCQLLF